MARRRRDAGVEECKGYSPPNDHTTSASSTPLPLGSWNLNTGTRPTESEALGRLVWLQTGLGTPSERNDSACMMLTKDVCREALVLLQVNTVVSL